MRILVTNDDGIDGPGLAPLARTVRDAGHDVVVCAPLADMSGAGAAFGSFDDNDDFRLERRNIEGLDSAEVFGLAGAPGRAVMAAHLGVFGHPINVVVAGINPGVNTGRTVLHSGTVGAALTASNLGGVGLAVSLGWSDHGDYRWQTAAEIAGRSLDWLVGLPPATAINLNVPNIDMGEVKGIQEATLAPFGAVRSKAVLVGPEHYRMEMDPVTDELPVGSDTRLVAEGYCSVTSLTLIRRQDPPPRMVEAFS